MKTRFAVVFAMILAVIALGVWSVTQRPVARPTDLAAEGPPLPTGPALAEIPRVPEPPLAETGTVPAALAPASAATKPPPSKVQTQKPAASSQPRAAVQEPIQDPAARFALSLVGADPDAEAYWISAINDPSLSAHERQDLIEDLNEEGFSDPRRPTADELPLIVSRLWLIEDLAPYAMDSVNADAFQEAYKDLANMAARLAQR